MFYLLPQFFNAGDSEVGDSNFTDAKYAITKYIFGYYSQTKPYQHNGGISPNKTEELYWNDYKSVVSVTLPLVSSFLKRQVNERNN